MESKKITCVASFNSGIQLKSLFQVLKRGNGKEVESNGIIYVASFYSGMQLNSKFQVAKSGNGKVMEK